MALVALGHSQCRICDRVIRDGDEYIGFSDFGPEPGDPSWMTDFVDAAVHRACFVAWDKRDVFLEHLNAALRLSPDASGLVSRLR